MRPFNFPALRIALYVALAMFSIVLLALSADRLHYTLTLKRSDPLNQGRPFYDHIIAELIFTTSVTILWSFYMCVPLERIPFFRSLLFMYEFTGLFVLWVFWLVGAAISSVSRHLWGDLSWCWSYIQCRILSALVAFAWTGWATLTILGTSSVAFVLTKKAARRPAHGRYLDDDDGEFRGQVRQPNMRFLPNFNRSG
ncbi:hypothetical protein FISHEDRAFT_44590 [Fistulina hepatica ATCC 64428]|uniref:MARVEL domain-containing protein n=1 Tax=Fistulina hepatica ATCC 64428 TaxID=1128425 RepID=A0A0D7A9Y9_9AGAR|nr:hypothetical protein FISHEDRAFT_44590 [Fistulina hepatica ATCC 64428]